MITAEYLRDRLEYNPETGEFIWKSHPDFPKNWRDVYVGQRAGSTNSNGYRQIRMNGARYKAHRLAWLHVYGVEPAGFIDHIDGERSNNAILNLRVASVAQNNCNRRPQKNNRSGVKNVIAHSSGKWQVQIRFKGRSFYFGTFESVDDAKVVADRERIRLHGEFACAA